MTTIAYPPFPRFKYGAGFQRPSRLWACVHHIPKTCEEGWFSAHRRMLNLILFSLDADSPM